MRLRMGPPATGVSRQDSAGGEDSVPAMTSVAEWVPTGGFGSGLRQLRLAAGLSQRELALRVGTTQSAIARLEAGRCEPRLCTLEKLAGALNCDFAVQLRGRDPL